MLPAYLQKFPKNCEEKDVVCSPEVLLEISLKACDKEGVESVLKLYPNVKINNTMCNGWVPLRFACSKGSVEIVDLLLKHPDINVNAGESISNESIFSFACLSGSAGVVELMLKDDRVLKYTKDIHGCPILIRLAQYNHFPVLRMLAKDPGFMCVDVCYKYTTPLECACANGNIKATDVLLNELGAYPQLLAHPNGNLPLESAVQNGYVEIVKLWIASEKPIDFERKNSLGETILTMGDSNTTFKVRELLREFKDNPRATTIRLKSETSQREASFMFAVIVFLCDGLFEFPKWSDPASKSTRFLLIVHKLPIEIQMMICHRMHGSGGDIIGSKHCENAFREIAEGERLRKEMSREQEEESINGI
jgi:ankyrin repeat protein